ncbi:hypothetical protein [uncultured Brevundimonas sp.]|uniref:hypothetical protein n=1 Tax=uncultured Brevundimonas sp. TaxID=213418 RepID=UPI0025E2E576|nr:hypothetical protein [uncultured Brevundimonas sp.]
MTGERIFNVFLYFDDGVAREYGVRHHRVRGDDTTKMAALAQAVATDHGIAQRFVLPRTFTPGEWASQQRLGVNLGLFEEGIDHYRASPEPLYCLTSIVDGVPRAEIRSGLGPHQGDMAGEGMPGTMPDWLVVYTEGGAFRFDKLINDDYFVAIKLLFNARHIASTSKLLMSCIDTLAFVEFGDKRGNFVEWLKTYADLEPVGVTADELWEFRNSIVHMTNLSSRAVLAGKASSLAPYIGSDALIRTEPVADLKPFNLYTLNLAVIGGVSRWAESYNRDRSKFEKFVERYDTIVSDSRVAIVQTPPTTAAS